MSEKPPEGFEFGFTEQERTLIKKLREKGVSDSETRELLEAWTIEQEAVANQKNTPRANIEFNLKRAKIYLAAGYADAAWENLECVYEQAENEGEVALRQEAINLMKNCGGSSE